MIILPEQQKNSNLTSIISFLMGIDVTVDNNPATNYTNMLILKSATRHLLSPPPLPLLKLPLLYHFGKFNCDQCSKRIQTPECKACDRMVNYFRIFNIPEHYAIDPKTVRNMAKDLQKEFHPDIVTHQDSEPLTSKMAKYSTYINEAKATLLNDLQRAIYLMELKGVRMTEEVDTNDSQFMMDIFEINQEIENATLPQAEDIKRRLDGVLKGLQQDLQDFFQSQDMKKCKEFVAKYKYLHSAVANVKQRIASLQEKAQEGQ